MIEEVDSRSNACLAYAVYYFSNSATSPVEVVWAYSQDLCAELVCAYCRMHPDPARSAQCPGVWEHAQESFARLGEAPRLRDAFLELGAFLVPRGLDQMTLGVEIRDQIRNGTLHAIIA